MQSRCSLTPRCRSGGPPLGLGLINRVVPPEGLRDAALDYADRLAKNGPLALQAVKRTALQTSGLPLADAFAIEARESAAVMQSDDAREGPRAFAEKREPVYRGR